MPAYRREEKNNKSSKKLVLRFESHAVVGSNASAGSSSSPASLAVSSPSTRVFLYQSSADHTAPLTSNISKHLVLSTEYYEHILENILLDTRIRCLYGMYVIYP